MNPEDIMLVVCVDDYGKSMLIVPVALGVDALDWSGNLAGMVEECGGNSPFVCVTRGGVASSRLCDPTLAAVLARPLPDERLRWGDTVKAVVAVPWGNIVGRSPGDLCLDLSMRVTGRPKGLKGIGYRPVGVVGFDTLLVEVTGEAS